MKDSPGIAVSCLLAFGSLFSVRAEQVVIREVMYHPGDGLYEYVELENITNTVFDIANWKLRGGVKFDLPDFDPANRNDTFLTPRQRIIFCGTDPETFRTAYGLSMGVRILGPWTGLLENGGERVTVKDKNGTTMCTMRYDDQHPWPVAPDGAGHSLVLSNHDRPIDDYRLWKASANPGGTPGSVEPNSTPSGLAINEVHFNDVGDIDWVEISNGGASMSTSGMFLSSKRDFSDKIPLGSLVPGGGFASWNTNFEPGGDRWVLFLVDLNGVVLNAVAFERAAGRDHAAAYPDGSTDFYSSGPGSRDGPNNPSRDSELVISELMVDTPAGNREGEFIELYNKGTTAVDLSGWRFVSGVDYRFPAGTRIAAGEYVVIAANGQFISEAHPAARVLGEYTGNLSNNNELLRLEDNWGNLADEVHYHTGGDWPHLAAGQGSSLELRHPAMDNSKPTAWADSDESNKSTFQTFRFADRFEQTQTSGPTSSWKELHLHCVGDAHLALRNMSLKRDGSGSNLLPKNGEVVARSGTASQGWLCQGNHHLSHMEGTEFHLISTGHGDVRANRCEIDVIGINRNDNLVWAGEARWISGKPTIIYQTWDRSFGGVMYLPIPKNLGTPGAPNSAMLTDAAPTISELTHSPAVPRTTELVLVTAKVESASANPTVYLVHRADSSNDASPWSTGTMFDDGAGGGDLVANDGIYSIKLGQYRTDNTVVQFYVKATTSGGTTVMPRPAPEKPALYVVDNSAIPGDLRTQRFVISQRSIDALNTSIGQSRTFRYAFPRLSNQYHNCTFIGNEDEVIYNCEFRKAGSPFQRLDSFTLSPAKTLKWKTPGDKRYRGWSRRTIDDDPDPSVGRAYHNRITRYWLYLLGLPANENEFVRIIVNGGNPLLREDVETNANDFLRRNWDQGEKGELYRFDDEWWFDDTWVSARRSADWSYKGTNEPERYHAEWMKRSRESEYDYSSFVNWVSAVGRNSFTRQEIESMADIDMMAAYAVVRGWIDDWDQLTRRRGKNGYFLRRYSDGKWMLIQWDSDLTFGNSGAEFIGDLAGVRNFFDKPYVRQRFNYYLGEMIDKYTQDSPRLAAWLDLEESASSSYSSNAGTYNNWNSSRRRWGVSEIGPAWTTAFKVTTGDGVSTTTSAETIGLAGTSGYKVFTIRVAGHPEPEWAFSDQTHWSLSGIQLAQGANNLTIEGLDARGNVVETDTFRVNKTGNALPVIQIDTNPDSLNVSVRDTLVLDATTSYDPEGTGLTFDWSVDNQFGADLTKPSADTAVLSFKMPGLYTITVTATDGDGEQATTMREAMVYAESGWSPFLDPVIEDWWTAESLEVRNDYSEGAWYCLDDRHGQLTLKVNEEIAKPLTMSSPRHPVLWRSVPDTGDCILGTDVRLSSVRQGAFAAGLILEVGELGVATRYAFGMENGDFLCVKRSAGGNYLQLDTVNWVEEEAVIRIHREGNQLHFDYRTEPGVWTNLLNCGIPTGSTLGDGGIFAATSSTQAARFEFDYVVVVDPGVTTPTLDSLRITEVMYNPVGGSDLEFIELMNTGSSLLNLDGVRFENGKPFDEFVFGDIDLAPGESAVVVANAAAFKAEYGAGIRIIGEWAAGVLSNNGERIVLSDPLANAIHDFRYDDIAPWPIEPDGTGPSLEVIGPVGDYRDPANWRASMVNGGTPGVVHGGDSDGDGLSDSDEIVLGTNPLRPDTDGDGALDGAEGAAGTDPLDAQSVFRLISVERVESEEGVTATWWSVPGRIYTLQASSDLTEGGWSTVPAGDRITATDATTSVLDLGAAGQAEQYYRVLVE